MKRYKILFSSNDIGSALQNNAFIKINNKKITRINYRIICNNITKHAYERNKFVVEKIEDKKENYNNIKKVITKFKPDFIIVGIAYAKKSIDDLTLKLAKELSIPTGTIQDYWGYLGNYKKNFMPDIFFVLDEKAKELTMQNSHFNLKCIVTGLPKFELYKYHYKSIRNYKRKEKKIISYFGQPKHIPGVLYNFKMFIEAINKIDDNLFINYKIHPSDYKYLTYYENLLKNLKHEYMIIKPNIKPERYLKNSNLIVTCYSTVGLDHNYLQLYSNKSLGNLLYILIGKKIKNYIVKQIGMNTIPSLLDGLGHVVYYKNDLLKKINYLLNEEESQKAYLTKVRKKLKFIDSPSKKILNFIENNIKEDK